MPWAWLCWLQGRGILSPALGPGYFVLRASYKMHTSGKNRRVPLLAQQLSHPPPCSQLTKGLSEAWGGQRPREAASSGSGEEQGPRLTFSLLLGNHWRWLGKGLAYLTIGSRVGSCWRAEEKVKRWQQGAERHRQGGRPE